MSFFGCKQHSIDEKLNGLGIGRVFRCTDHVFLIFSWFETKHSHVMEHVYNGTLCL